jgi:hypothetical protein
MKNIYLFVLLLIISFGILSAGNIAFAQQQQLIGSEAKQQLDAQDNAFIQASGLQKTSLNNLIARIIRTILSFLGVIFIILTIYAGLMWMTSAGNEDKIGTAKKIMIAAVIGLVIVMSAYAITAFVIYNLQKSTT